MDGIMTEAAGLDLQIDEERIGHLIFDRPGESQNILDSGVMERLDRILDELERGTDLIGLIVRSAKESSFIAGANIEEIARIESSKEAEEKASYGQSLFNRLEALPIPVVAAIRGTCLGGGTELALACHHVILADEPRSEMGLPEVRLGLIPGWGGTQRLPRRVPLTVALEMILTGKSKRGRGAAAVGLADRAVPSEYVLREAKAWIRQSATRSRPGGAGTDRRDWFGKTVRSVWPVGRAFFALIRKQTERKIRPQNYPAPFRAIDAVEYGLGRPLREGLRYEARLLGEMVMTETRRNLTSLFFLQRDSRKLPDTISSEARPLPVKRVGLLGAGIMGGGIAQLAAASGLTVRMKDLGLEPLGQGLRHARKIFEDQARRRRQRMREVEGWMARIQPTLDYQGFASLGVVLEAVVENLDVKRKVLSEVEEVTNGYALFASNTSSLRIDLIAEGCRYPENVLGMHFFNPVDRMPLVEVIRGTATSDEGVVTVVDLCRRLKKTPVVVRDGPGFLVNRILMAYLNEALQLLKEGMPIETADKAMKHFGMPMGPFELLDQIGIDVAQKVAGILGEAFGDRVRPPRILEFVLKDGRLGKKNARGFYRWNGGRRKGADPLVYALVRDRGGRTAPQGEAIDRMVLPMINEAALCLTEEIAHAPADVDLAMVMGTGFPPFRGGLLRHADALGIEEVVSRMDRLASVHGERFRPVPLLRDMARGTRRFFPPE